MAVEVIRRLVDDISGETADGTIQFSIGETRYQIDLSSANAREFEKDLERWVKAARKVGKTAPVKKAKSNTPAVKIDDTQAAPIREWAKGRDQDELRKMARSTGMDVPDRGRLSLAVMTAAYNVAHPTKRTAVKDSTPIPQDVVDRPSPVFSG